MTANTLKYKGYEGSVDFDFSDNLLSGKVLGIRAGLVYEAQTLQELQTAFRQTIDLLPIGTHGGVICGCHGVVHEQEETAGRNILCDSDPHSVLKNVSVCAFPNRYHWRNSGRRGSWSGSRIYT